MTIAPLQTMPVPPPVAPASFRPPTSSDSFASLLRGATEASRARQTREAAEQFVSTAFIQPMLALVREGSMAAGPFAPSTAERRFGPLLDQHLADRIVHSERFPLVARLEEHLLGESRAAPAREEKPAPFPAPRGDRSMETNDARSE